MFVDPLVVDPRLPPKKCATISAAISMSVTTTHNDPVSGYFCQEQSQVGFFTLLLPSDNSLAGPNIFLGKLYNTTLAMLMTTLGALIM
jgi:hypothetical protein